MKEAPSIREQEELERKANAKIIKKDVQKWQEVIKKNRESAHLDFTQKNKEKFRINSTVINKNTGSGFEDKLNAKLKELNMSNEDEIKRAELESLKALNPDEAKKRHNEILKQRNLMFYKELRNKRLSKIKSKLYHKIKKKVSVCVR